MLECVKTDIIKDLCVWPLLINYIFGGFHAYVLSECACFLYPPLKKAVSESTIWYNHNEYNHIEYFYLDIQKSHNRTFQAVSISKCGSTAKTHLRGIGNVTVTTYLCVGHFPVILYHYNCKVNEPGRISLHSNMLILALSYNQEALKKCFILRDTVAIIVRFKLGLLKYKWMFSWIPWWHHCYMVILEIFEGLILFKF